MDINKGNSVTQDLAPTGSEATTPSCAFSTPFLIIYNTI